MKKHLLILWLPALCFGCGPDDFRTRPGLDFPDCRLIRTELQTYFGTTQAGEYTYEGDRLMRYDLYINDRHSSTKLFTYDDDGFVRYMLTADSSGNARDTIGSYTFTDGRLSAFIHYDTDDQSILSTRYFEYRHDVLSSIRTTGGEGENGVYEVTCDGHGNPVRLEVIEVNNAPATQEYVYIYTYDEAFNPYYHLPDFIGETWFAPNNRTGYTFLVDGEVFEEENDALTYTYNVHHLPEKLTDIFSQGTYVTTFFYACD